MSLQILSRRKKNSERAESLSVNVSTLLLGAERQIPAEKGDPYQYYFRGALGRGHPFCVKRGGCEIPLARNSAASQSNGSPARIRI